MDAGSLVDDLRAARDELFEGLSAVRPESMTTPGLIGSWSARDLIAHLGYWAGHAAEVIHAVEEGRADEVGVGEPSVDEVNETVARIARQTDLATVRKREAASVEALVERVAGAGSVAAGRPASRRRHAGGGHPRGRPDPLPRAPGRAARRARGSAAWLTGTHCSRSSTRHTRPSTSCWRASTSSS